MNFRARYWKPDTGRRHRGIRPPVGALVPIRRKPVRIHEIIEIPVQDWPDTARDEYLRRCPDRPNPETWDYRPYDIIVEHLGTPPPNEKPDNNGRARYLVHAYRCIDWWTLPENYAVCVTCGELSPCDDLLAELDAERQMRILDDRLSIRPGCCWGCKKPITKRQKSITFEGENLDLPGGDSPSFHLRQSCRRSAERYEERWREADASRPLRLRCPGIITRHYDGQECSAQECTGSDASHQGQVNHYHYYSDDMLGRLLKAGGFPALDARLDPLIPGDTPRLGLDALSDDRLVATGWRCTRCRAAYLAGQPAVKY